MLSDSAIPPVTVRVLVVAVALKWLDLVSSCAKQTGACVEKGILKPSTPEEAPRLPTVTLPATEFPTTEGDIPKPAVIETSDPCATKWPITSKRAVEVLPELSTLKRP